MISKSINDDWRRRGQAVLRALVVVTCYLVVFAGLLYTVAGASAAAP